MLSWKDSQSKCISIDFVPFNFLCYFWYSSCFNFQLQAIVSNCCSASAAMAAACNCSVSLWMELAAVTCFLSLCILFSCLFRSDALANALVQELQTKGFSPRCLLSWSLRWDLCLKALSHIWHANGLSLLWTLSCFFKSGARIKDFPHTSQL